MPSGRFRRLSDSPASTEMQLCHQVEYVLVFSAGELAGLGVADKGHFSGMKQFYSGNSFKFGIQ